MNTAILFDTMSIQQYVFGSNKLKDNIGASYIIENIYSYLDDEAEKRPLELSVGYIGGGNALIFTISEDKAKEIVRDFTTMMLYTYPGVSVAVAIMDGFRKDDKNYSTDIKYIFKLLAKNKGEKISINTLSSHGITAICQYSSLSVEKIDKHGFLLSSTTYTKRNYEEKARKKENELLSKDIFKNYQFPDELDDLGQNKGEDSHIAVVHIDGNGFGEVFRNLKNVKDTKELSEKVKNAVKETFVYMLEMYITNEDSFGNIIHRKNIKNKILPIRPIILGGDDVTFVCHSKLGIWFAERFIEKFQSFYIDDEQKTPFSASAGIAIVKTKYPFYRAYQLAEELCNSAKKKRKDKDSNGNWIDFQMAYSGLGNTLEEVRRSQYYDSKGQKPLFKRPYSIERIIGNISLSELKKFTLSFKESLPNTKIKDLREMLTRDEDSQKVFIEHLKHQHNRFDEKFCNNGTTENILDRYPFFDMIELLELYPTNLLK